jgi:hypothetical protein
VGVSDRERQDREWVASGVYAPGSWSPPPRPRCSCDEARARGRLFCEACERLIESREPGVGER